jgi:hypothetical protein
MLCRCIALAVLALFLAGTVFAADEKAEQAVKEYLAKLKAPEPQTLKAITDEAVTASLPDVTCFAVTFRQYPIAILAPEPLKSGNVLAVKDGKVEPISDRAALEKFLKANLKPVKDEAGAKAAAYTWVRLSQELHQDGFFKFSIPKDDVKAEGAKAASAKAVVDPQGGNKGEIVVGLAFADGKLAKAEEKANVQAGIRPICQATKLLDADPIVRKMAEKDILVMGQSCKDYLDEQRAKASPELRKAIDRVWQRILDEGR